MKISKTLSFFILLLYGHLSFAQEAQGLNWWNPAGHEFCVIDNQGWPADELSHYDRLPQKVEEKVIERTNDLLSLNERLLAQNQQLRLLLQK